MPRHGDRPLLRHQRPRIVLIGGYAGSGKSELARLIAQRTGWAVLDKDTMTGPLVEVALEGLGCSPQDRESEIYRSTVRPAEYEGLLATIVENMRNGASVVATAPFIAQLRDSAWCAALASTAEELAADLHIVWVRCDVDSMLTYIRRRGAARDAAKLAAWESYLDGVDLDYQPLLPYSLIDTSMSSPPLIEQVNALMLSYQDSQPRTRP